MESDIKKYLFDIQDSLASIEDYLGGTSDFEDYNSNKMLRRAIEREFEIIGEAMNHIENISPSINITGKKKIINVRNRVIHGYDKVDNHIIWGIIIEHLPNLRIEIEGILNSLNE